MYLLYTLPHGTPTWDNFRGDETRNDMNPVSLSIMVYPLMSSCVRNGHNATFIIAQHHHHIIMNHHLPCLTRMHHHLLSDLICCPQRWWQKPSRPVQKTTDFIKYHFPANTMYCTYLIRWWLNFPLCTFPSDRRKVGEHLLHKLLESAIFDGLWCKHTHTTTKQNIM